MAAINEMARVKREVDALVAAVETDLRPRSKSPMTPAERRFLRSEIEHCAQRLDELRNRLSS
jgi:hypothetical protein